MDDDPKVSRIVARWLSDYRVSIARDAYEALAIIRSERVDLLIVDYVMPSMTGQELVEMCQAEGRIFCVLLLTGYADILEREDSWWWDSRARLTKPVDVDELRAAVARQIGGASSSHGLIGDAANDACLSLAGFVRRTASCAHASGSPRRGTERRAARRSLGRSVAPG